MTSQVLQATTSPTRSRVRAHREGPVHSPGGTIAVVLCIPAIALLHCTKGRAPRFDPVVALGRQGVTIPPLA